MKNVNSWEQKSGYEAIYTMIPVSSKKKNNNERRETIEKRGGGPRREVTSGSGLRVSEENDGRVLFSSL